MSRRAQQAQVPLHAQLTWSFRRELQCKHGMLYSFVAPAFLQQNRIVQHGPSDLLLHASCRGVPQQGTSLGKPQGHRNLALAQPVRLHDTSTMLPVLLHAQGLRLCAGSDDSISLVLKRPPALLPRTLQALPLLSHADLGVQPIHLSLPDPLEIMPLSSGLVAEALEGLRAAFHPQASH